MYKEIIHAGIQLPRPKSFYCGLELPGKFALPDNILLFSHAWHPGVHQTYTTNRHRLEIPAVPLIYETGKNDQYEVNPGHVIFIRGCQDWRIRKNNPDLHSGYLRLIITFELKDDQQFYLPDKEVCRLTPDGEACLVKLYQSFKDRSPAACAIALFQLLSSLSENQLDALPRSLSEAVRLAMRCINVVPFRNVTLTEIAAEAKTSVSNLRWLFRREIGMSIGRFILEHRMKVARHHLAETNLSLGEIAELCGFQSVYSFSHFFSRNEGISPGRYRQTVRETSTPENK